MRLLGAYGLSGMPLVNICQHLKFIALRQSNLSLEIYHRNIKIGQVNKSVYLKGFKMAHNNKKIGNKLIIYVVD